MHLRRILTHGLLGATALVFAFSRYVPGGDDMGPVLEAATRIVEGSGSATAVADEVTGSVGVSATRAVSALSRAVRPLSHPQALETAFRSYFAFRAAHPSKVRKPYLYFVDYGLPSTKPRGYVFDMEKLTIVDGPFTVAHGRGSSRARYGIPTRFSNGSGSNATSLGLYLAEETYAFRGRSGGRSYTSVGLRLAGVSRGFNDNARARGVVAHGAPYVTRSAAGRSEGCPAMEQARARLLLPKLANGGMVFHFAPDERWIGSDRWVVAGAE
jgi:hypothetical protein